MRKARIYDIWCGIKSRCHNPNKKSYKNYGEKGIYICDDWRNDFLHFYNWSIKNGYSDDLTIDRIDNLKGYCPENCRWVSHAEQQRNRTNNVFLENKGQIKTLAEWCRDMNEPYQKIYSRKTKCLAEKGSFVFDDLFYPQKTERKYTKKFYERKHFVRKIIQYTKDGSFIKTWESIKETSDFGFSPTAIINCCKGKTRSSGGYIWKYAEG
jgi:hypothetical protein